MEYSEEILEDMLNKDQESGWAAPTNRIRIIIPTQCSEPVRFSNPDDLPEDLKERWKNGERSKDLENQTLKPGGCLITKKIGLNFNQILMEEPDKDWYKTPDGIKKMIDKLYDYASVGAGQDVPGIWDSDFESYAKNLSTLKGKPVDEDCWNQHLGKAFEAAKPSELSPFINLECGDTLGDQTAGVAGAIAIRQNGHWHMVQKYVDLYLLFSKEDGKKIQNGASMARMTPLNQPAEESEKKKRETQTTLHNFETVRQQVLKLSGRA